MASETSAVNPTGGITLDDYTVGEFFDELIDEHGRSRPDAIQLVRMLNELKVSELQRRQQAIERSLYNMGITFTVYSDDAGTEKIMPFDIIPRIISSVLWHHIEAGIKQRISALNRFLSDIYSDQAIVKEGLLPPELIQDVEAYLPQCVGLRPFHDVWCHVSGTDLVRDASGAIYVLEDNLRCPSGVSYVLQNRMVMKRNFPKLFGASKVRPVNDYPSRLYEMLQRMAPPHVESPVVVVLTPGTFNSAYYEHSFLAQQMGVELVEGRDLLVIDNQVFMRTIEGLKKVDVIYRRIDDDFLDPEVFRKDSVLGVAGLMRAYSAGNVALSLIHI